MIYMPNLEILDLSDNPISDDGIRSVDFLFIVFNQTSYAWGLTSL